MIAVTGATGQLGRHVIDTLVEKGLADKLVAAVRDPSKAADLAAKGVTVREADYNRPETLASAFEGVDTLLLISSSEMGQRTRQHRAVIDAAKAAGVKAIAYTSLLHADKSPMSLAVEHRETEAALAESGIPHVLLRNGWYSENYAADMQAGPEQGAIFHAVGEARVASAARQDYAEAAAVVVANPEPYLGKALELAGDSGFTMAELADEIARQSGKPVVYNDLSEENYASALEGHGLPNFIAEMLASSDAAAREGWLFDDSRTLSRLIGRPTTPMAETVRAVLAS